MDYTRNAQRTRRLEDLTDDQLFGEVDLEEKIKELEGEVKSLNAFLVHKGFAEEYIRWQKDGG